MTSADTLAAPDRSILPTLSARPLPKWLTALFWLNLACQVGIVVTGVWCD